MFNARKPDGTFGSSSLTEVGGSTQSAYAPSAQPVSIKAKAGASNSIIDEWLTMKGDLESEVDILVKGKVFGNIRCKLLIVDTEASIEGGIVADEVVVRGKTKGVIDAGKVRLEKTANVDSEIRHDTFSAEEGAKIRGALKIKGEAASEPAKSSEAKAA